MKKYFYLIILFAIITASCDIKKEQKANTEQQPKKPKNIILMIGDGMGLTQMYATYKVKKDNMNIARCRHIGLVNTSSIDELITDSAASGTAMATGEKTRNGHISVDTAGKRLKTILEVAEANGKASGLVATAAITHATPASFIAHNPDRNDYEAIATDFLDTGIDVFIGGGLDHFDKREDGLLLTDSLVAKGYDVMTEKEELLNYQGNQLAALLYAKHPPKVYEGRQDFLEKASNKAIEILDKDKDGFFLMIESSQIDWGGHDNDADYVIQETVEFDDIVGKVLDFAEKDGETLVIITADHETGGMTVTGGSLDGENLEYHFSTGHHTPLFVPLFAYGPGAEEFTGIYENTAIFDKMMQVFGFENKE